MEGFGEPDHLEGEGFYPIIGWISEGNGQIDLPKWHGLLSGHDTVERCSDWADACLVDAHFIEHLGIHDVEAATSIYQYFGESLWADDWVDHKRISPRVWDGIRMVGPIEGYGRFRPPEEGSCRWLGRVDFMVCDLLTIFGVIGR